MEKKFNKPFIGIFCKFSAILLLLIAVIFREFLFGEYYFMFKDLGSDSYGADYPFIHKTFELMRSGNWHGYSFGSGLGKNVYASSLDPVLFSLAKFTSFSAAESLVLIMITYVFLSGIFMFLFLQLNRLHYLACCYGGIAYAFSAYILASGAWVVGQLSMLGFLFIFLLYALLKAVQDKNYFFLTIAFLLMGINAPITLYFGGFISLIFLFIYHYQKEKTLLIKKEGILIVTFILLGIGISAFMWLPYLQIMLLSPRGSGFVGNISLTEIANLSTQSGSFVTGVLRLFSPNLLGSISQFKGFANYLESSSIFCGIATLFFFFQAFKTKNKRNRVIIGVGSCLILLSFASSKFRWLINGSTGDYFRNLNLLSVLFIVIVACFALSKFITQRKADIKILYVSAGAFLLILFLNSEQIDAEFLYPVIFFVAAYGFLIFLKDRLPVRIFAIIFSALLFGELVIINSKVLSEREICSVEDVKYGGYEDASKDEVARINANDKTFFRLEKNFNSHLGKYMNYENGAMQGYRSSPLYSSFGNVNYIKFLKYFGQINVRSELDTRWVPGISSEPLLMNLASTKYFLSAGNQPDTSAFEILANKGQFAVIKNKNYLPFGFCYDYKTVLDTTLSLPEKFVLAYSAISINPEDEKYFGQIANFTKGTNNQISVSEISKLREDTLRISNFSEGEMTAEIKLQKPKILFVSIPFDNGWEILDNGNPVSYFKAFSGLTCLPLTEGIHHIEFTYSPPKRKEGIFISVLSVISFFGLLFFLNTKNGRLKISGSKISNNRNDS